MAAFLVAPLILLPAVPLEIEREAAPMARLWTFLSGVCHAELLAADPVPPLRTVLLTPRFYSVMPNGDLP